jgi:oxygen-independent coproporphyrinogen-3 oxidase
VASDAEVTLEVNPGTVDRQRLGDYRSAGVNRLNIGLQSLKEATLRSLGRIHSADQGLATYRWAEAAGFDNLGIDLIYGLPGQTLGGWRSELQAAVDLAPRHLSCYTLTVEPGTPLAARVDAGDCQRPDEKRVGDLFTFTIDDLARRGYRQYEISNFARRAADPTVDWRSRHNRKYWNGAPYLGFGPSAHSFRNRRRWWNHRDLERYLAACRSGRLPTAGEETLTREQRLMESIYLGLRQTDGIDADAIGNRFGIDLIERLKPELGRLTREGLVGDDASRIRLTVRGMLFLEQVAGRLLEIV